MSLNSTISDGPKVISLEAKPLEIHKTIENDGVKRTFGEFWTSAQRQMHSLHYVVSYRASFKPELPDFFIRKYAKKRGDVVLDPFMGRGTTILQANILGRVAIGNDINPLAEKITYPKCNPPRLFEIRSRLNDIDLSKRVSTSKENLSMFYHKDTLKELVNLKNYLKENRDHIDRFIELLALSRLHGHSSGFFSVYSFPQLSVPRKSQIKINKKRKQKPEYRDVKKLILRKARSALKDDVEEHIRKFGQKNKLIVGDSRKLGFEDETAKLVVTSPPFLATVDYLQDNWLKFWFLGIDTKPLKKNLVQTSDLDHYKGFMEKSMGEMYRVLKQDGVCVIEVGEVTNKGKKLNLDEVIWQLGEKVGFNMKKSEIVINSQEFTKLANCFNVDNMKKGTNTNRCVILKK